MIKILKEFDNTGKSKSSIQKNKMSALDLAKKYKFSGKNADNESGLVIGSNGLVAVQYDVPNKKFAIRPDNNLALGVQDIDKFKQDFTSAEKLLDEISKL